jgi:hypothetical protein
MFAWVDSILSLYLTQAGEINYAEQLREVSTDKLSTPSPSCYPPPCIVISPSSIVNHNNVGSASDMPTFISD